MGKGFKHGISVFNYSGSSSETGLKIIACSLKDDGSPDVSVLEDDGVIAVVTDIEVKGCTVSPKDPYFFPQDEGILTAVKREGWIWVKTGSLADANSYITIGNIELYPIVVYQCVNSSGIAGNGEWAPRTAYVKRGSYWYNWYTYLYGGNYLTDEQYGIGHKNLTGGWVGTEDTDSAKGNFSVGASGIYIGTGSNQAIFAHTQNAIDLTHVKTIFFEVDGVKGSPFVSVHATENSFHADGRIAEQYFYDTGVVQLNVNHLYGKHYVAIGAIGTTACECTCDNVYMQYGS